MHYNRTGKDRHKPPIDIPSEFATQLQKLIDTGQFDPAASKALDQLIVSAEQLQQEEEFDHE